MSGAPNARLLAAQAVAKVLDEGSTLDAALSGGEPKEVRSAVRSLAYGAVRGYHRYFALWKMLSSKPPQAFDSQVRAVLAVAFFELQDGRSPEYAVVDAAVESIKAGPAARAAGLVNALLRRYLRERSALDLKVKSKPASCHAAPAWLTDRLRAEYPSRWAEILAALDAQAPMWLRVDARQMTGEAYLALLGQTGRKASLHPGVPQAVQLAEPCDVFELPGFEEGLVSVQDLSAQCALFPLALTSHLAVLDACAAPGGKTALMGEAEPTLAITAVDSDPARLDRLTETLKRCHIEAKVQLADAANLSRSFDQGLYDRILVDAPCSALGVIRRHPDIKVRKGAADLARLPLLQSALLKAAWSMLKVGGRLVYATCTITRTENRDVIARFVDGTAGAELVPPERWDGWPGLGESDGVGRQILPGESGADGFYYAAINKS